MKPSAEIIVVRYGQPEVENRCIRSLCLHTDLKHHKLTVEDNHYRDKNLGALWNELIERSHHPYVCLLNSDTEVEAGWIDSLIEGAETTGAEATGPVTNHCGNPAQRTARGKGLHEVKQLSGFCLLLLRSAWQRVKGFREDFPFYGQESNFMNRIGKKIICRSVFVHHEGGASVKASGRQMEERKLSSEFWYKQVRFDWNKRLAILGSGPGNPFPLWKGIDQAVEEFSREGMVAQHFPMTVNRPTLKSFNPDVILVVNTHKGRLAECKNTLQAFSVPKAVWFNDLRDAVSCEQFHGAFDHAFLCFQSSPGFDWGQWERATGAKVSYMPQGSIINAELEPLDVQRRLIFIGSTNTTNGFHSDRKEVVKALGAEVLNGSFREDRIEIEQFSSSLYRQSAFSLVMSPKVCGYNSLRLYNVLAYGGLALIRRFPGLERLFQHGQHVLGFATPHQAKEVMDQYEREPAVCEQIRRRGWRYQQAKHTVAQRLMNMVANLTTTDQSFWGQLCA